MFELYLGMPYMYECHKGSFATLAELMAAADEIELDPDEEIYYETPDGEWVDL